jgi:hypothetical protein
MRGAIPPLTHTSSLRAACEAQARISKCQIFTVSSRDVCVSVYCTV